MVSRAFSIAKGLDTAVLIEESLEAKKRDINISARGILDLRGLDLGGSDLARGINIGITRIISEEDFYLIV